MSIGWSLVCIDCGESLSLGKAHWINNTYSEQQSFGFSMIGNIGENQTHSREPMLACIQHFLILHRGHELRVLPENSAEVQDTWLWTDMDDEWTGNLHHLLSQPIDPPNPDSEVSQIKKETLDRLRQSGVNAYGRLKDSWKDPKPE